MSSKSILAAGLLSLLVGGCANSHEAAAQSGDRASDVDQLRAPRDLERCSRC